MKTFGFNPPQERIEPKLWVSSKDFTNVNTGRALRNSVLDGKTIGESNSTPNWLKTRDAVHNLIGMWDTNNIPISMYGTFNASASSTSVQGILNPRNTSAWWTPGGNGVDSWSWVKLPEATFVESYGIGTKSTSVPLSWKLQGSMDGTVWVDLHTVDDTGVWNETYEFKEFIIPEEMRGTYFYYKLLITASNSSTMSIRNFRLFRPTSICGKGQIFIDATPENPLILSYTDGLDIDGVTPIDIIESVSSSITKSLYDENGHSTCYKSSATTPLKVNIYAVRNNTGDISIDTEIGETREIIQAEGGMGSADDKGWICSSDTINSYNYFGKTSGSDITIGKNLTFTFLTKNPNGVFASKLYVGALYGSANMSSKYTPGPIYAIEMDDSVTYIGGSKLLGITYQINRKIKGIRYTTPNPSSSYSVKFRGMSLYSNPNPKYSIINGNLVSQETSVDPWVKHHKIRIGSCLLDRSTGEVFNPQPYSAFDMRSMVNGNVDTDLT